MRSRRAAAALLMTVAALSLRCAAASCTCHVFCGGDADVQPGNCKVCVTPCSSGYHRRVASALRQRYASLCKITSVFQHFHLPA